MSPVTRRRLTRLCTTATLAIAGSAALGTIYLVFAPLGWTPPGLQPQPAVGRPREASPARSLDDLAVIWQRDLRQPVIDVPAKPTEPTAEPKLAIRLLGTAIETDRQYGLFQLASSATVVKAAGGQVEDFEIVAIERGKALLRRGSRDYELKVAGYDRLTRSTPDHGH